MSVVQSKKLFFTPKAWIQMWRLTEACDIEISALGLLLPGRDDVVQEFYVPKQKCSPVYTEMFDDALSELQMELVAQGVDTSRLRVFFHSHVNMAASPSGTDEATIDRLANGAFLWSIITNKTGAAAALTGKDPGNNLYLRLDTYDPVNHTSNTSVYRNTITNCSFSVMNQGAVSNKWVEESLAKVNRIQDTPTVVTAGGGQFVRNGWQQVQNNLPAANKVARQEDDDDFPAWWNWRGQRQATQVITHQPQAPKKIEVVAEEKPSGKSTEEQPQTVRDNIGYWARKWLSS